MDPKPENGRTRVVLVDDDGDSREPFAEFLRMSGFDVEEFETADDALDAIGRNPPAAAIMDISLSRGIDGFEAARRIRAMQRATDVRLVAMTGHPREVVEQQGPLFDAILTKPMDPYELVAVVKRLVS